MYRRNRYRRRVFKRKRYLKKRIIKKFKNNGIRYFKLRYEANVQSGQSQITDDPTFGSPTGWSQIQVLFGYYRVAAMHVRYVPDFTNIPPGTNPNNNPIIVWHDWNTRASTFSRADLITAEGARFFSGTRAFSFFRKMVRRMPTGDTPAAHPMQNGFIHTAAPQATQSIKMSIDGANNAGTIVVTKYLICKQRR